MLKALLAELQGLPALEPIILLDQRCRIDGFPDRARIIRIESGRSCLPILDGLLAECDLFWPIAPETDGTLAELAKMAAASGVRSIISTPAALRLCTSKFKTSQLLKHAGINAVETRHWDHRQSMPFESLVLKPDDGVGCEGSFVVFDRQSYRRALVDLNADAGYVVQPYIPGRSLSLSCLCKNGRGWLLSCNEHESSIDRDRFTLTACRVNVNHCHSAPYQALVERVAAAIPGLWGYIGIDVIESERDGLVVLEINPRLTTSYCGIHAATGINVAEQVIRLLDAEPEITKPGRQTIIVNIQQGT